MELADNKDRFKKAKDMDHTCHSQKNLFTLTPLKLSHEEIFVFYINLLLTNLQDERDIVYSMIFY